MREVDRQVDSPFVMPRRNSRVPHVVIWFAAMALAILAAGLLRGEDWYVAPDGTADGSGSQAQPLDLTSTVASSGLPLAGDRVLLKGGVYRIPRLTVQKHGITIQSAPGEWAKIEFQEDRSNPRGIFPELWIPANDVTIRDLELYSVPVSRLSQQPASSITDLALLSINPAGLRIRFLNNVIHDCTGLFHASNGGEIYGNVVYNVGWIGIDRFHGHCLYIQNKEGSKVVENNIVFGAYGIGIHAYGTSSAGLNNISFVGNVSFNNGATSQGFPFGDQSDVLIGGFMVAENITFVRNRTWQNGLRGYCDLGYQSPNGKLVCTDNHVVSQLRFRQPWSPITTARNEQADGSFNSSGFKVWAEQNKYQPGRSHVVVYNWDRADSVKLGGFAAGPYKVRHVLDLATVIAEGTFDGTTPIDIPLKNVVAPQPIGETREPSILDKRFSVFILDAQPGEAPTPEPTPDPDPNPQPPPFVPPPTTTLTSTDGATWTLTASGQITRNGVVVGAIAWGSTTPPLPPNPPPTPDPTPDDPDPIPGNIVQQVTQPNGTVWTLRDDGSLWKNDFKIIPKGILKIAADAEYVYYLEDSPFVGNLRQYVRRNSVPFVNTFTGAPVIKNYASDFLVRDGMAYVLIRGQVYRFNGGNFMGLDAAVTRIENGMLVWR